MVINSVLSTGVEGVKSGVRTAQNAAQEIATLDTSPQASDDSGNILENSQNTGGLDTLTGAIVDLKIGENQVKASAAVIRTADEMLGTLVDIKA